MTWGWEAMSANVKDGYVEGLLRGYRGGLLTAADYNNLCQCENLDDVKLHLVRRRAARGSAHRSAAPAARAVALQGAHTRLRPGHDGLCAVPAERAVAAAAGHHRGEVHAEAGGRVEPPALPGARP